MGRLEGREVVETNLDAEDSSEWAEQLPEETVVRVLAEIIYKETVAGIGGARGGGGRCGRLTAG